MKNIFITILVLLLSVNICSSQIDLDKMVSDIYTNQSKTYFEDWVVRYRKIEVKDTKKSLQLLDTLLFRTAQLKFDNVNAQLYYIKSLKYNIKGNYALALSIINQIIPTLKKNNDVYLGACYNSASDMLAALGDGTTAITYIKKAIEVTENQPLEISNTLRINNYLVYGSILSELGKKDLAHQKYLLALDLIKASTGLLQSREMCFTLLNLSVKDVTRKEFNKALKQINTAINISEINEYPFILSIAYLKKANTLISLKKIDSAVFYMNKSFKITKKHKYNSIYLRGLKLKSEIFELQNKPKKAYEALLSYTNLKKSNNAVNKMAMSNFLISTQKRKEKLKAEKLRVIEKNRRKRLNTIIGFLIAIFLLASIIYRQWNKRKVLEAKIKKETLERKLIQNQIQMISSQMNPHFVFNALNSVQGLILQKDIKSSSIYLNNFAQLMRNTLENYKKEQISVFEEIKILTLYLELENLRFNEDFTYNINCNFDEEEQHYLTLPPMLLQPYVENSIKHGLLHKKGKKILTLNFFKDESNNLSCEIIDNGIGIKKSIEINKRWRKNHKPFATLANQKRIDLINENSESKTILTITDIIESDIVVGTKVLFIFK